MSILIGQENIAKINEIYSRQSINNRNDSPINLFFPDLSQQINLQKKPIERSAFQTRHEARQRDIYNMKVAKKEGRLTQMSKTFYS